MGQLVSSQRTDLGGKVQLEHGVPVEVADEEIDALLEAGNRHGYGLIAAGVLRVRRGDASTGTPEERAQTEATRAKAADIAASAAKSAAHELEARLTKEQAAHRATAELLAKEQAAHAETRGALEALRALGNEAPASKGAKKG